jgi:hypothetical protein
MTRCDHQLQLVEAYFDPEGPFAADTFDSIGTNDPAAIGPDDLLAVTYLNVQFGPQATPKAVRPGWRGGIPPVVGDWRRHRLVGRR